MIAELAEAIRDGLSNRPEDGPPRQNAPRYFLFPPEGEPPADVAGAVAVRSQQWNSSLKPWNSFECWLTDFIAYQSIELERCALAKDALARRRALAASSDLAWGLDRRAEAAALGARLPGNPERVVAQLRRSLQGAEWLLRRLRGLGQILESGGDWDEPQRRLALDVLGMPIEARDAEARRGLPATAEGRAELVREEIATLEELKARVLVARDADEQAAAMAGTSPDESPEARALRRHEAACLRALKWAHSQFKVGRHDLGGPPATRPARPAPPRPAPAPVPSPSPKPAPEPPPRDPAPTPPEAAPTPRAEIPAPPARPPLAPAPTPPKNRRARRAMQKLARRRG